MATKAQRLKEQKRAAIVARLREMQPQFDVLSGMWDERTLDTLVLVLGIGHVYLDP